MCIHISNVLYSNLLQMSVTRFKNRKKKKSDNKFKTCNLNYRNFRMKYVGTIEKYTLYTALSMGFHTQEFQAIC